MIDFASFSPLVFPVFPHEKCTCNVSQIRARTLFNALPNPELTVPSSRCQRRSKPAMFPKCAKSKCQQTLSAVTQNEWLQLK